MLPRTVQVLAAVSNAVSTNSVALDTQFVVAISAQAISTGTPTGTIKLQASDDPMNGLLVDSNGNFIPLHWNDIPNTSTSVSAAGSVLIAKFDSCYRWVRAVYTDGSSGSATGTTTVNLQAFGF